jgi:prepilin-type N-terminal cleavage/methylation domain-containing protein
MNRQDSSTRFANHGFTLVEIMIVVALMGIIAVSVIPSMNNVQRMREGAARDDVARMLDITRSRAMATGLPTGVRVDVNESTLTLVELTGGTTITQLIDPLTYNERVLRIADLYNGVEIDTLTNGDGSSGSGYVWFGYDATPHTRLANGTFDADNDGPVRIELTSGQTIVVHPFSGVVELQ